MLSAEPVCSCAHFFVQIARETAGAARTRLSLRPLFSRAGDSNKTRAHRAAGMRSHVCGHCEERSDEAIHSCLTRSHGLLRGACHRVRIRATRWLAMTVYRVPDARRRRRMGRAQRNPSLLCWWVSLRSTHPTNSDQPPGGGGRKCTLCSAASATTTSGVCSFRL